MLGTGKAIRVRVNMEIRAIILTSIIPVENCTYQADWYGVVVLIISNISLSYNRGLEKI